MVKLYHYTDRDSYNSIQQQGCIHCSSKGRDGRGVYLTEMNPKEHDNESISKNNYGSGWKKNLQKTDHHILVDIPDQHPKLERFELHKWVFRDDVHRSMFTLEQGANEDWDPLATLAIAGGVALGASLFRAYTAYQEQNRVENLRKMEEEEERRKVEATRASMMATMANISMSMQRIQEVSKPSDFVASSCNIGAEIDEHVATCTRRVTIGAIGALVSASVGLFLCSFYPNESRNAAYGAAAVALACTLLFLPAAFVRWNSFSAPDDNSFHAASRLRSVISEQDCIVFRQKSNEDKGFWERAASWVFSPGPFSKIDCQVRIKSKGFGFVKIVTVSLPLAAAPYIARRYYWIGMLGKWYVVTVFHYHTETKKKS